VFESLESTPLERKEGIMTPRRTRITLSVFFLASISLGLVAGEWYVAPPPLGSNKNHGTEELPFATIQKGIDAATEGDTVIVAKGTYVENIRLNGKNIVLRSTDPTDWNVVKETIIDGDKSGSVVTFYGTENETCVLSGFTIRNGTGTYVADPTYPGFYGGGILGALTHATIQNNIIAGNSANGGGGMCDCEGVIRNNVIIGNRAETGGAWNGGGIGFCDGVIQDNLIAGNSASCGGGISFSNAVFRNNIVVGNTALIGAQQHGGGLAHLGTSPYGPAGGSITNCIIWGNTAATGPQVHDCVAPIHCCIQDWTGGGTGNIALDPGFVDPDGPDNDPNTFEDNDYRLLPSSPCIDAGINEDWMNGAFDLNGKPRILLGASSLTVDMGAYELRFPIAIVGKTETEVELSWTMRPLKTYTVLSSFDMMLQPWAEETTIFGGKTGGPTSWLDPGATSAIKFYKIEIE
jgi:hypothetical protein